MMRTRGKCVNTLWRVALHNMSLCKIIVTATLYQPTLYVHALQLSMSDLEVS